jgi:hypothetical protein
MRYPLAQNWLLWFFDRARRNDVLASSESTLRQHHAHLCRKLELR